MLRATRFFIGVSSALFAAATVLAIGWYVSAARPPDIERLDKSSRERLVEQLMFQSPGIFMPAYFEPRIGYVLRPSARLTAWGTTFRSNSFGYRTRGAGKGSPSFRLVFIGDSWTFGMGVD